jgi:hypothetical protein
VVCLATALAHDKADKSAANSKSSDTPMMVSFTELKWTELPERKGMQFSVLSGDPKTGAYAQIRKVPAGTDNPLHSHSSELKNVIISGVWYTGADAASAKDFGPGSVVVMPGGWTHVSGCRSGSDCVFYQGGEGEVRLCAGRGREPGQVALCPDRTSAVVRGFIGLHNKSSHGLTGEKV